MIILLLIYLILGILVLIYESKQPIYKQASVTRKKSILNIIVTIIFWPYLVYQNICLFFSRRK